MVTLFVADTIALRADQLHRLECAGIPAFQFIGNPRPGSTARSSKATKDNEATLANLLSGEVPRYRVIIATPEYLFPSPAGTGKDSSSTTAVQPVVSLLMTAIQRLHQQVCFPSFYVLYRTPTTRVTHGFAVGVGVDVRLC